MWRILVGLNSSITLSFLPVGHTEFAPDWCFGLLKQKYRKTFVSKLANIVSVVQQSSRVNKAQLVGTQEGEIIVFTYDWHTFLQVKMKKVPDIKRYHHFTFKQPG